MNLFCSQNDRWCAWHVIAGLIMVSLGVAVTFDAWADIYHIASIDEEYSHIFLVPIVALYLVWVRRVRFRFCTPTGTLVGPVVALLGWATSAFGFYHNIQSLWHAGAVLTVVGCLLSVVGKNVLFRFFPAFAVLIFLIPVPGTLRQQIALPLQSWTAQIGQSILEILGIETVRSGNQLSVNGIPVAIAEACNGLRMVFALILVSYAFSFGLPLRNSVRFFVLILSPLAAIGCNVIRIVPTVWLYGYHSKQFADQFHDYSGWIMLPIAFAILYALLQLLKWAMIPVTKYTLASQA
jgi:exosortase